jgi:hypothetical protein
MLSVSIGLAAIFLVGCSSNSLTNGTVDETYNPIINSADFVAKVDNPYFPLKPGTTFIYQGETEDGIGL